MDDAGRMRIRQACGEPVPGGFDDRRSLSPSTGCRLVERREARFAPHGG